MRRHGSLRVLTAVSAVALTAAACGSSSTPSSSGGASQTGPPYSVTTSYGTFKLSSAIATKIQNKQPLNFVLSFQTLSSVGAPAFLAAGMKAAAAAIQAKYGVTVNTKVIGPAQTDPVAQISQVQQAVAAGQVDCLAVEPVTPDAFTNVINDATTKGVPTFTVNTDSPNSHRFAYYGPNDTDQSGANNLGIAAGKYVADWATQNNVTIHKIALITGDTTAPWAQGRMQGFMTTLQAKFPSVQFVGTPTNAFTTGYDDPAIVSKMQAFITGHPDVDFYFDSDWGAKDIGKLIGQLNLKNKVYTLGYNVDSTYLDQVTAGNVVATLDQRFDLQAGNWVTGCGDFLLAGKTVTGNQYVPPTVVNTASVAAARQRLASQQSA
jgi:ABC-type sugar transport system substrate-binding protein